MLLERRAWVRGAAAVDREGRPCDPVSDDAVAWSICGALAHVDRHRDLDTSAWEDAMVVVATYAAERGLVGDLPDPGVVVAAVNDAMTSAADAAALLRQAARRVSLDGRATWSRSA